MMEPQLLDTMNATQGLKIYTLEFLWCPRFRFFFTELGGGQGEATPLSKVTRSARIGIADKSLDQILAADV